MYKPLQAHPNSSQFVILPTHLLGGPSESQETLSGEESCTVQWVQRGSGRRSPESFWHRLSTFKIQIYRLCLFSLQFPCCGAYIFICGNKSQGQLMWPSGVGGDNHCGQCSLENNHNNKQRRGRELFEGG